MDASSKKIPLDIQTLSKEPSRNKSLDPCEQAHAFWPASLVKGSNYFPMAPMTKNHSRSPFALAFTLIAVIFCVACGAEIETEELQEDSETASNNMALYNYTGDSEVIYQAEEYNRTKDCRRSGEASGFHGTGFVDFGAQNSWTQWKIKVKEAGYYRIGFRYASGCRLDRPCSLIVNRQKMGEFSFEPTGTFSTWEWETPMVVYLKKGRNRIRLKAVGLRGGPNIDELSLERVTSQ